jgi:hypothetical protein
MDLLLPDCVDLRRLHGGGCGPRAREEQPASREEGRQTQTPLVLSDDGIAPLLAAIRQGHAQEHAQQDTHADQDVWRQDQGVRTA